MHADAREIVAEHLARAFAADRAFGSLVGLPLETVVRTTDAAEVEHQNIGAVRVTLRTYSSQCRSTN